MRQRQSGQMMVIFGLSLLAIVAMLGVVLDGGNIYVQRRTAQNAADAAALAGARALLNAAVSPDSTIGPAICNYAAANAFGVTPTATAYFVGVDGVTNEGSISVPTNCSTPTSNTIPNGLVAGIHVDVAIPFNTFVAGILRVSNLTAEASATAQVGVMNGILAADAPVAGCGVQMDDGVTDPNIFVGGTPPTLDYGSWLNHTFILQSSQLWKHSGHPPCPRYNSGNGNWKGTISPTPPVTVGSDQPTSNGNSAAPLDTACTDSGQGNPTSGGTCYLAIPITDGNNPQSGTGLAHIVAFACMQISSGNGVDRWSGTLSNPNLCGATRVYSYSYNWSWAPGSSAITRIALTH